MPTKPFTPPEFKDSEFIPPEFAGSKEQSFTPPEFAPIPSTDAKSAPAAIKPPAAPSGILRRTAGDIGVAAAKGLIGVPQAVVGILDIPTLGYAGKAIEATGLDLKGASDWWQGKYSPEAQEAQRRVHEAPGFIPSVVEAVKNPSAIVSSAVESAPGMFAGSAVARGAMALPTIGRMIAAGGKAATAGRSIAAGLGEAAITAGQNTEQVREMTPGGVLTPGQAAIVAGSGLVTGALGTVSGKIAARLGIRDIDTWVAGQPVEARVDVIRRIVEGMITEGVLEELPQSAQEQVAINVATGRPPMEGVGQAGGMGMLVGGVIGAGANIPGVRVPPQPPPPARMPQEARPPQAMPTPSQAEIPPPAAQNAPVPAAVEHVGLLPWDIFTRPGYAGAPEPHGEWQRLAAEHSTPEAIAALRAARSQEWLRKAGAALQSAGVENPSPAAVEHVAEAIAAKTVSQGILSAPEQPKGETPSPATDAGATGATIPPPAPAARTPLQPRADTGESAAEAEAGSPSSRVPERPVSTPATPSGELAPTPGAGSTKPLTKAELKANMRGGKAEAAQESPETIPMTRRQFRAAMDRRAEAIFNHRSMGSGGVNLSEGVGEYVTAAEREMMTKDGKRKAAFIGDKRSIEDRAYELYLAANKAPAAQPKPPELMTPKERRSLENTAFDDADKADSMRRLAKTHQELRREIEDAQTTGDRERAKAELRDVEDSMLVLAGKPERHRTAVSESDQRKADEYDFKRSFEITAKIQAHQDITAEESHVMKYKFYTDVENLGYVREGDRYVFRSPESTPRSPESTVAPPKSLPEALHAGDPVKPPRGATFLRVNGKQVVAVADRDTLKGAGPFTSAEWGIKGKSGFVPMKESGGEVHAEKPVSKLDEIRAKIRAKAEPAAPVKVSTDAEGDKTVSVPEADKPGLPMKEQKKYLLAEIDKAIEGAPADESGGQVTIEVPNDGTFTVFNHKGTLENFKKAVQAQFPSKVPEASVPARSMAAAEIDKSADAAIDLYGNAKDAAAKIRSQIERMNPTEDAETDKKNIERWMRVADELDSRANIETNPSRQKTHDIAVLRKRIAEGESAAADSEHEKAKAERVAKAITAMKAHTRYDELRTMLEENHSRQFGGIARNPMPQDGDLLNDRPEGRGAPAIRELQDKIAGDLGLRRAKKPANRYAPSRPEFDLSRYWKDVAQKYTPAPESEEPAVAEDATSDVPSTLITTSAFQKIAETEDALYELPLPELMRRVLASSEMMRKLKVTDEAGLKRKQMTLRNTVRDILFPEPSEPPAPSLDESAIFQEIKALGWTPHQPKPNGRKRAEYGVYDTEWRDTWPEVLADVRAEHARQPIVKPPPSPREPWRMTQREYLAQESKAREFGTSMRVTNEIGADHAKAVSDALAANLPVPDAVLSDYPELKPEAKPSPAPEKPQEKAMYFSKKANPSGRMPFDSVTDVKEETDDLRLLRDELRRKHGNDADAVRQVQVEGGQRSAIEAIAGAFGHRIVWFDVETAKAGDAVKSLWGLFSERNPGVIYMRPSAPMPIMQLFGHELTNAIRTNDPKLYLEFRTEIESQIRDFAELGRRYGDSSAVSGRPYAPGETRTEEFTADYISERFLDPQFWEDVNRRNPSLVRRIAAFVKDMLEKIQRVASRFLGGPEVVIEDLKAVRDAAADMVAKYGERGEKGTAMYARGEDSARARGLTREQFDATLEDETRAVPFAAENVTSGRYDDQSADGAFWRMLAESGEGQAARIPVDTSPVSVPVTSLTPEVLARMDKIAKREGYDSRGGKDVREYLVTGRTLKDGTRISPAIKDGMLSGEWSAFYREATVRAEVRAKKAEDLRAERAKHTHVNRDRIRTLGYTTDLREAGYITPTGQLIDLSGKREGGSPHQRSYDHREAGGTAGMEEFMAEGNIRINGNQGQIDIAAPPTEEQMGVIEDIIAADPQRVIIDVSDGIGAWDHGNQRYKEPSRRAVIEMKPGWNWRRMLNEIRAFYDQPRFHRSRNGVIRAITYGNRSHFFLDRYDNLSQLRRDIREEAGHRLVNELGGSAWRRIGLLTYRGSWQAIAGEIERNYGVRRGSSEFNHELVAKAFRDGQHETGLLQRFMDAVVSAFRELARRLGFTLDMTDAEVRVFLRGLLEAKARGMRQTGKSMGEQALAARGAMSGVTPEQDARFRELTKTWTPGGGGEAEASFFSSRRMLSRDDVKHRYPSLTDDVLERIGRVIIDSATSRIHAHMDRIGTSYDIQAFSDRGLLHEIGHILEGVMPHELWQEWKEINSKQGVRFGKAVNALPEKASRSEYGEAENLFTAFALVHKMSSGHPLDRIESDALKAAPLIQGFVERHLVSGKSHSTDIPAAWAAWKAANEEAYNRLKADRLDVLMATPGARRLAHGTKSEQLASVFPPFSHFGTTQAAQDRLADAPGTGPSRIMDMVVVIRHPKRVQDLGLFSPFDIVAAVAKPSDVQRLVEMAVPLLSPDERADAISRAGFTDGTATDAELVDAAMNAFRINKRGSDIYEMLYGVERDARTGGNEPQAVRSEAQRIAKASPYDGLVYQNEVEDPGSDSYVIFDSAQAKSAEVAPDDTGRIPPPSEWGNPQTPDIRFARAAREMSPEERQRQGEPDESDDIRRLRDSIQARYPGQVLPVQELHGEKPEGAEFDAIAKVADAFGTRVVWYSEGPGWPDSKDGWGGGPVRKTGTRSNDSNISDLASEKQGATGETGKLKSGNTPDANTVFLNINAKTPLLFVLGHELTHNIQRDNPKLYQEFFDAAEPFIKIPEYVRKYVDGLNQGRASEGLPALSPSEATIEFFPDLIGEYFQDRSFWDSVGRENPSLMRKIAVYLSDIVAKIKGAFSDWTGGIDAHFIRDAGIVRELAADMVAKYANDVTRAKLAIASTRGEFLPRKRIGEGMTDEERAFAAGAEGGVNLARADAEAKAKSKIESLKAKLAEKVDAKTAKQAGAVGEMLREYDGGQAATKIAEGRMGLRAAVNRLVSAKAGEQAAIRREIIEKAKESIPDATVKRSLTRHFLAVLTSKSVTDERFNKALAQIDSEADAIQKRELIAAIKQVYAKSVESMGVNVLYRQRIRALMGDFLLSKPTEATLAKARELADFLDAERNAGSDMDLTLNRNMAKLLRTLTGTPLKDMSAPNLEDLFGQIYRLATIGRLYQQGKNAAYRAQQDADLASLAGSTPLEYHTKERAGIGGSLTPWQTFKNAFGAASDALKRWYVYHQPMDVVFDLLDGAKHYAGANYMLFKSRVDNAFSAFRAQMHPLEAELDEMVRRHKIGKKESERIGVYAIDRQATGREKLLNTYSDGSEADNARVNAEIDAIQLTPDEMAFYEWMRGKLDAVRPEIERVMRDTYNAELEQVDHYFPFITDWSLMENASDMYGLEMGPDGAWVKTKAGSGNLKKNTEQGFTIKRKGAGGQAVRTDAIRAFHKHMQDVNYYTQVGPTVKYLQEIANRPEYGQAVGEMGQRMVREYLDTMARQGGMGGAHILRWVDALRNNIGVGTLGYRLSSILIQPTSFFDGAGLIGGRWAFKGALSYTQKDWRDFVWGNMTEIHDRIGDDWAFGEANLRSKIARYGFLPLQTLDEITAGAIAAGAYEKNLHERGLSVDFSKPDAEALAYAQKMVRRTQASPSYKDQPLAISRGALFGDSRTLARAIYQFQTFTLNKFSFMGHDGLYSAVKNKEPLAGLAILAWTALAFAMEEGIRAGLRAAPGGGGGDDDFDADKLAKNWAMDYIQVIPWLGSAVTALQYNRFPAPVVSTITETAQGVKSALTAKSPEAKERGVARAIGGIGTAAGIPGTSQGAQWVRNSIKTDSEQAHRLILDSAKRLPSRASEGRIRLESLRAYRKARANGWLKPGTTEAEFRGRYKAAFKRLNEEA